MKYLWLQSLPVLNKLSSPIASLGQSLHQSSGDPGAYSESEAPENENKKSLDKHSLITQSSVILCILVVVQWGSSVL